MMIEKWHTQISLILINFFKKYIYIIKSIYFFRGEKEKKINLIITSNFIKLINYENKFKNNLKNLSICNDGFSINLVIIINKKIEYFNNKQVIITHNPKDLLGSVEAFTFLFL